MTACARPKARIRASLRGDARLAGRQLAGSFGGHSAITGECHQLLPPRQRIARKAKHSRFLIGGNAPERMAWLAFLHFELHPLCNDVFGRPTLQFEIELQPLVSFGPAGKEGGLLAPFEDERGQRHDSSHDTSRERGRLPILQHRQHYARAGYQADKRLQVLKVLVAPRHLGSVADRNRHTPSQRPRGFYFRSVGGGGGGGSMSRITSDLFPMSSGHRSLTMLRSSFGRSGVFFHTSSLSLTRASLAEPVRMAGGSLSNRAAADPSVSNLTEPAPERKRAVRRQEAAA